MSIAQIQFNKALRAWRARQAFLKHGIREIPNTRIRHELSASQKEEVDVLWGGIRYRQNYRWHEFFYGLSGHFDARYVPAEIHFMDILPVLNNADLRLAWEDKAFYTLRFPGIRFPTSLAYCIHGRLYDANYQPTHTADLLPILQEYPEVLVKPTLDTFCGKGVQVFNPSRFNTQSIDALCADREGNCVFQVPLSQHAITAALNASSCNIVRINTLRTNTDLHVLNATIRFGDPGNRTDVSFDQDGIERLNLLGLDSQGHIMEHTYTAQAEKDDVARFGLEPNTPLPGFDQAIELCLDVHTRLPHFDLAAFDVAIGEDGLPVLIEVNLGSPGVVFYQFMHGPFFGEYTEQVVAVATAHKQNKD